MNNDEILMIIREEGLNYYNWYNSKKVKCNQVCIDLKDDHWIVFTTDERQHRISENAFDNENDALQEFIKRLRASNRRRKKRN
ncbi:hypothetical protein HZI73_04865 [Vallitalea pronyensis]|uniref:Uncharacterized protein n=1 Tax=Vallitalea pronyensis TaxID=1348613 RepID=A0A8J8MHC2_9FIRM|nr:Imm59 family immunity protein [Vallitalea pronyensis]QUI21665.1 hypothetical protein HZI73_04865 [Vallitalea pronyensis]